eukprot:UN0252
MHNRLDTRLETIIFDPPTSTHNQLWINRIKKTKKSISSARSNFLSIPILNRWVLQVNH